MGFRYLRLTQQGEQNMFTLFFQIYELTQLHIY